VRQLVGVILLLNGLAVVIAAVTGNLPNWPPGQADIHVASLAGAPIIHLGGAEHPSEGVIGVWNDISFSNSILTMWLVIAVLVVIGALAGRTVAEVPGRFQGFIEMVVQLLVDFMRDAGGLRVVSHLPLFGTLFLFAWLSNWLSIVPFVGQVEWLRAPTSDYHTNLGMALTGFVYYQAAGIRQNGLSYFTRWVNYPAFKEGALVGSVMFLFVGPIELFSELFRILTLTLRLWGNIWGGEIVLAVLAALLYVPSLLLPFLLLELFIGFIQAFVFAFLVLLYIILALESHGGEHEEHPSEHEGAQEAEHAAA